MCKDQPIAFKVEQAKELPSEGLIKLFYSDVSGFNPYNNQGTFLDEVKLPKVTCESGQVLINEVMVWPTTNDNMTAGVSGEWIELIGPPGTDLGCYILTDGDWVITIPPGYTIPADGTFVIGNGALYPGKVDLDPGSCGGCSLAAAGNGVLSLDNTGEYIILYYQGAYTGIIYGSPSFINSPPLGALIFAGNLPTPNVIGCVTFIIPAATGYVTVTASPMQGWSYEREPDGSATFIKEECPSMGECNMDVEDQAPFTINTMLPAIQCGKTLYVKAIIDPYPGSCPKSGNALSGEYAFYTPCGEGTLKDTLCHDASIVVNGNTYDINKQSGDELIMNPGQCDSLIHVKLQFIPKIQATLSKDASICKGDSATLTVQFSGPPPYTFTYVFNGTPVKTITTSLSTYTFKVSPPITGTYTLQSVTGPKCVGEVLGEAIITVNNSTAVLPDTVHFFCPLDTLYIPIKLTGTPPFTLGYTVNGVYQELNNVVTNPVLIQVIPPVDSFLIKLVTLIDDDGCNGGLMGSDTFKISPPVQLGTVQEICSGDNTTYTVQIPLIKPDTSLVKVYGINGSFVGNTFITNPIPSGGNYSFFLLGPDSCEIFQFNSSFTCVTGCNNSAGSFAGGPLHVCGIEDINAVSYYQNNKIVAPGDTLIYILQDANKNIIASAQSPIFNGSQLNLTPGNYTITLLVGPIGSNGWPDTLDPCLKKSNPFDVNIHDNKLNYSAKPSVGSICQGCFTLNFDIIEPAENVTIFGSASGVNPGGAFALNVMQDTISKQFCLSTGSTQVQFTIDSINSQFCPLLQTPKNILVSVTNATITNINPTLCFGESTTINGITYDASNPNGKDTLAGTLCDSILNIQLQFYPNATGVINGSFCGGDTIQVGNQKFYLGNASGTVSLMKASQHGCDSTVTVNAQFSGFKTELIQKTLCNQATLTINGKTYDINNPKGTDTLFNASASGCDSVIIVDLTFGGQAIATLSGPDVYCQEDSMKILISIDQPGIYNLEIQYPGGATNTFTGVSNGNFLKFSPAVFGTYTILSGLNTSNQCTVIPGAPYTVIKSTTQPKPPIQSDYNGFNVSCNGEMDGSVEIVVTGANGSEMFLWETGDTSRIITGLGAGDYRVTISDAFGCIYIQAVTVTEPLVIAYQHELIPPDCSNPDGKVQLNAITGGAGPYEISWDNQLNQAVTTFPAIYSLGAGDHAFIISDANGCTQQGTVSIQSASQLKVSAGQDLFIDEGSSTIIQSSYSIIPLSVKWTPPLGLNCDTCLQPIASPLETMIYKVQAKDSLGCLVEDEMIVNVNPLNSAIYIPNVISADNNSINDRFNIIPKEGVATILRYEIYNRWGDLLYEIKNVKADDPLAGWDAKVDGRYVDPGVYVYMILVKLVNSKEKLYKGDVTVFR